MNCFPNTQINRNCLKAMVQPFLCWLFLYCFSFSISSLLFLFFFSSSPSRPLSPSRWDTHLTNFSSLSHVSIFSKEPSIRFSSFKRWPQAPPLRKKPLLLASVAMLSPGASASSLCSGLSPRLSGSPSSWPRSLALLRAPSLSFPGPASHARLSLSLCSLHSGSASWSLPKAIGKSRNKWVQNCFAGWCIRFPWPSDKLPQTEWLETISICWLTVL